MLHGAMEHEREPGLRFSLNAFPNDVDTQESAGLLWGCTLQPFAPFKALSDAGDSDVDDIADNAPPPARLVARCRECGAFISHLCELNALHGTWVCALCGKNDNSLAGRRYERLLRAIRLGRSMRHPAVYDAIQPLQELRQRCTEFALHARDVGVNSLPRVAQINNLDATRQRSTAPATLLVIDTAGVARHSRRDWAALLSTALQRAVAAFPPEALIAIVFLSDWISMLKIRRRDRRDGSREGGCDPDVGGGWHIHKVRLHARPARAATAASGRELPLRSDSSARERCASACGCSAPPGMAVGLGQLVVRASELQQGHDDSNSADSAAECSNSCGTRSTGVLKAVLDALEVAVTGVVTDDAGEERGREEPVASAERKEPDSGSKGGGGARAVGAGIAASLAMFDQYMHSESMHTTDDDEDEDDGDADSDGDADEDAVRNDPVLNDDQRVSLFAPQIICVLGGPPSYGVGSVSCAGCATSDVQADDIVHVERGGISASERRYSDIDDDSIVAVHATTDSKQFVHDVGAISVDALEMGSGVVAPDESGMISEATKQRQAQRVAKPAPRESPRVNFQRASVQHSCDCTDVSAKSYFTSLAAWAADLGVAVSVHMVLLPNENSAQSVDSGEKHHHPTFLLQRLCARTGGGFWLYPSLDDACCRMPHIFARWVAEERAVRCLLRLRTSAGFDIDAEADTDTNMDGQSFGADVDVGTGICMGASALARCTDMQRLWLLGSCDPRASFAFSFRFVGIGGLASAHDGAPAVQMSFAYSVWRHGTEVRVLRVLTADADIAEHARDVQRSADVQVQTALLARMACNSLSHHGAEYARELVRKYLLSILILSKRSASARQSDEREDEKSAERVIEAADGAEHSTLLQLPTALSALPRLAFSMIHGMLLAGEGAGDLKQNVMQCSAAQEYMRYLVQRAPPQELCRLILPEMLSFFHTDADSPEQLRRLSLSAKALHDEQRRIGKLCTILLDEYMTVCVCIDVSHPGAVSAAIESTESSGLPLGVAIPRVSYSHSFQGDQWPRAFSRSLDERVATSFACVLPQIVRTNMNVHSLPHSLRMRLHDDYGATSADAFADFVRHLADTVVAHNAYDV